MRRPSKLSLVKQLHFDERAIQCHREMLAVAERFDHSIEADRQRELIREMEGEVDDCIERLVNLYGMDPDECEEITVAWLATR